jgi:hypothetical protein
MKLSGLPGSNNWVDFWLDTGKPADYFPLGSIVTARVRINSDTRVSQNGEEAMFSDNWWDADSAQLNNNEWSKFSFAASNKTFSKIGFETTWLSGTFAPTDTFEIDWIQITTPDSFGEWNTWQTCTTVPCAIDPATLAGNAWIQYKLDLTTTNPATTPKVTSVSYQGDYAPSGTYTSPTETFPRTQELLTFDVAHTVPASTTANYEYSLDNGGTWQTITPGTAFPEGTLARTFTWRTTFTTTNPATTPTLTSVTLTTYTPNKSSSTAIKTRVANLEAAGKVAEATAIRTRFPHLFTDSAPPDLAIQAEFIEILEETVFVLRRVIELREET